MKQLILVYCLSCFILAFLFLLLVHNIMIIICSFSTLTYVNFDVRTSIKKTLCLSVARVLCVVLCISLLFQCGSCSLCSVVSCSVVQCRVASCRVEQCIVQQCSGEQCSVAQSSVMQSSVVQIRVVQFRVVSHRVEQCSVAQCSLEQ